MNIETPVWRQVRAAIVAEIAAGEFPPGTPLPAEKLLAERFSCAIGTIRRATDGLVAEGVLTRQQGRGTFVAQHTTERSFRFFHLRALDGTAELPRTEFLDFSQRLADREQAAALGVALDAPLLRARHLQHLGGRPAMLEKLWLPEALFPGLDGPRFAGRPGTVYDLYQREFGISVTRIDEQLRAAIPSARTAARLGLRAGEPALFIQRIAFAVDGKPVELRLAWADTRDLAYFNSRG
ncbi:MAG: GntR family transcriptional regulator [Roseococcus sp.]